MPELRDHHCTAACSAHMSQPTPAAVHLEWAPPATAQLPVNMAQRAVSLYSPPTGTSPSQCCAGHCTGHSSRLGHTWRRPLFCNTAGMAQASLCPAMPHTTVWTPLYQCAGSNHKHALLQQASGQPTHRKRCTCPKGCHCAAPTARAPGGGHGVCTSSPMCLAHVDLHQLHMPPTMASWLLRL
jgi:hypothetical protein